MSKVKLIKADAIVNLTLGTVYIEKLQKLMFYLLNQLTPEQTNELLDAIRDKKEDFSDPLLAHTISIVQVVRLIEEKIVSNKLFVEEEVNPDDILRHDQAQ